MLPRPTFGGDAEYFGRGLLAVVDIFFSFFSHLGCQSLDRPNTRCERKRGIRERRRGVLSWIMTLEKPFFRSFWTIEIGNVFEPRSGSVMASCSMTADLTSGSAISATTTTLDFECFISVPSPCKCSLVSAARVAERELESYDTQISRTGIKIKDICQNLWCNTFSDRAWQSRVSANKGQQITLLA